MQKFLVAGNNGFQKAVQQALATLTIDHEIISAESESSLRANLEWLARNRDTIAIIDGILYWQTDAEKEKGVKFRPEGPIDDLFGGQRVARLINSDTRTCDVKTIVYTTGGMRTSNLYNTPSNIFFLERDASPDPAPLANLLKRLLELP